MSAAPGADPRTTARFRTPDEPRYLHAAAIRIDRGRWQLYHE